MGVVVIVALVPEALCPCLITVATVGDLDGEVDEKASFSGLSLSSGDRSDVGDFVNLGVSA